MKFLTKMELKLKCFEERISSLSRKGSKTRLQTVGLFFMVLGLMIGTYFLKLFRKDISFH